MFDLTNFLHPLFLGFVEGATEFLPVSSTAHIFLADKLIGGNASSAFEIAMQVGAIIAVLFFEWRLMWKILTDAKSLVRLAGALLIAFLPAAIVGLTLHKFITTYLFSLPVIGTTLLLGGIMMLIAEKKFEKQIPTNVSTPDEVTYSQALAIGCAQVFSIIPGVSRALTTIYGGLFVKLPRAVATEFSFLLAVPILGAASFYEVVLNTENQLTIDTDFWVATGASFVFALLALKLFFAFVKHHDFRIFGWYRIVLGAGILGWIVW